MHCTLNRQEWGRADALNRQEWEGLMHCTIAQARVGGADMQAPLSTFCFLEISLERALEESRIWMAVSSSKMFPSDAESVSRSCPQSPSAASCSPHSGLSEHCAPPPTPVCVSVCVMCMCVCVCVCAME